MDSDYGQEQMEEAGLGLILKEIREFRKVNSQQLKEFCAEINKANTRIEEAEKRIDTAETQGIQGTEEAVTELLKLQIHLGAKLTDLEGCSRGENVRIHKVKEGAEEDSPLMVDYVECLLREGLGLQGSFELRVERAHHALTLKPPPGALPRSFVARLASYRMKEELLKLAWQMRGFQLHRKSVYLDHDYALDVLKKPKEYAQAKSVLKEKKIRFQTLCHTPGDSAVRIRGGCSSLRGMFYCRSMQLLGCCL